MIEKPCGSTVQIGVETQMQTVRPQDRIRVELRQHATEYNSLYDQLLRRFAAERVLHRIETTAADRAVTLRGAWAIETHLGVRHRRWNTVQLTVHEPREFFDGAEAALGMMTRSCGPGDDGLEYWSRSSRVADPQPTWSSSRPRHRIKALINLDSAEIPFEMDVEFNRPVVPEADVVRLDSLLDLPPPHVRVARFETLVAEKLKRIVRMGVLRFRARDYFDLWLMVNTDPLDEIEAAVETVFRYRPRTRVPAEVPPALTERFATSDHADWHWSVFLDRGQPVEKVPFSDVVAGIRERVMPVFESLGTPR